MLRKYPNMPESMGGSSKQKLVFKPVSSNPIENPSTLKFAIKENQWDYVLKYIFDEEEVPSEFRNIFLTDPDIAGTIFKKVFAKFKNRLLELHQEGSLQAAMKNARFDIRKIGTPNGGRGFKLNLVYYEDLLNQKTQSVTDWVRIQNEDGNPVSEGSFRNTNIRFLQHVIAPNWYLFHAYLMDEISSHDSQAVEGIVREDIISILEVSTSEK